MDSVLLVDQSDPTRLYQQGKAVEAQRALYDLKAMTEDNDDEVVKAVKSAIDRTNQLVGLLLASRLVVRHPVQAPQVTLEEYASKERES